MTFKLCLSSAIVIHIMDVDQKLMETWGLSYKANFGRHCCKINVTEHNIYIIQLSLGVIHINIYLWDWYLGSVLRDNLTHKGMIWISSKLFTKLPLFDWPQAWSSEQISRKAKASESDRWMVIILIKYILKFHKKVSHDLIGIDKLANTVKMMC